MNGKQRFLKSVRRIIKCTAKQAEKVFDVYKKEKVIKCDIHCTGDWTVNHGEFWEPYVLWNAINLWEKIKGKYVCVSPAA